ncbi:MAG: hypothetical protein M3Q97_05835 [Bacteroidota bacterium]|nr:hypothetical protein [Bacteroidota bacterium]
MAAVAVKKNLLQAGNVLAHVFHPLFLFTYGSLLVFFSNEPQHIWWIISGVVFTVVLPLVFTWLLQRSLYLEDRHKRTWPLLVTAVLFAFTAVLFRIFSIPRDAQILIYSFAAGLSTLFLINFSYKISLHACGLGAYSVWFGYWLIKHFAGNVLLLVIILLGWILILCIVLWQRAQSGAHTPAQVLTGLALGILSTSVFLVAAAGKDDMLE